MQTTWATGSRTIRIHGNEVVVEQPRASPNQSRLLLSEAFHAPHRLNIGDVRVRAEVVSCLARQLKPDGCQTDLDRLRLMFWANLQRVSMLPLSLDFSDAQGRVDTVQLSADHLRISGSHHERDSCALLDDVFFYGPKVSCIPLESQRALRAAVYARLNSGSGLKEADGFELIDPDQLEAGDWSWSKRADGESAAVLQDGRLMIGYSCGRSHEQGYGCYPLARTLRQAPGLYLSCPPTIAEAIRSRLAAAVVS